MKILTLVLLYFLSTLNICSQYSDLDIKFDNDLYHSRDTINGEIGFSHYRKNYFKITYCTNYEFVKSKIENSIKGINKMPASDKVKFTENTSVTNRDFTILVGESVPYQISIKVIEDFIDVKNLTVILQKDISHQPGYDELYEHRKVMVGSGKCPITFDKRYLESKEKIKGLLIAESQEDFINYFNNHNDRIIECNYDLNRMVNITPVIENCIDVEDFLLASKCSHEFTERYIIDSILIPNREIFYTDRKFKMSLLINSEGRVINFRGIPKLKSTDREIVKSLSDIIMDPLSKMPLWKPKIYNGKPIDQRIQFFINY
ncbi:hypothetical protein CEQ90_20025 [Lewinellaceae bacterium SD302]|nr:hypothetical protein CEQ90_20025 [Lewinellaceae bacterium SD302]